MKLVDVDGFTFDFPDAIEAFVFDEKVRSKPTFHGLPMKAVDIVVELDEAYVFIEIKDFHDPHMYDVVNSEENDLRTKRDNFKWLKNYLKYKYRDSFLCRYAEEKVDKPIHYICLLTFDNAINIAMRKALIAELPVGKKHRRWNREFVKSCQVVNLESWNRNFPNWPVEKISA